MKIILFFLLAIVCFTNAHNCNTKFAIGQNEGVYTGWIQMNFTDIVSNTIELGEFYDENNGNFTILGDVNVDTCLLSVVPNTDFYASCDEENDNGYCSMYVCQTTENCIFSKDQIVIISQELFTNSLYLKADELTGTSLSFFMSTLYNK